MNKEQTPDYAYFKGKLEILQRDLTAHTSAELARHLARLAKAANEQEAGLIFQPAQLEKAPEPVGFQVRSFYTKNEWTGHHKFETTQEVEESNGEWRYVFASPPEVAELQKQVQALQIELHSLQATKDAQYSGLKTNFDDACKMLRDAQAENNALQAENERLKFDRDVLKASFVKLAVGNIKPKDKS